MKKSLVFFSLCLYFCLSCLSQIQGIIPTTTSKTLPMRTDTDIAHAIKGAFGADKFIAADSAAVSVQVENGVATLSGTVATDRAKNEIGAKARGVGGVRQVVNNIQVQGKGTLPKSPTGPAKLD